MVIGQYLFSILLFFFQTGPEKELTIIEDLTPQLKIFKDNTLQGRTTVKSCAVHLSLDLAEHRSRYLLVESKKVFYLFINSTFVLKGTHFEKLNADSLIKRYSNSIFLSVYQKNGVDDLSVKWALVSTQHEWFNPKRPLTAFSNFILLASLVLVIFFTVLFSTNPQLTLDYLNFTKLFYFRDREENQITLRITSSVNLLFYLFCSLLASLALITAVHFTKEPLSFLTYSSSSITSQYLTQWLLLALAIVGVLMAKLAFVAMLAMLFGWRDATGVQFFNFVRTLILSLALIAFVSLLCFSLGVAVNHYFLLKSGCILLVIGAGLLYFKLQARTTFRSFHLFSYLCATEIFPLMILIKLILF